MVRAVWEIALAAVENFGNSVACLCRNRRISFGGGWSGSVVLSRFRSCLDGKEIPEDGTSREKNCGSGP